MPTSRSPHARRRACVGVAVAVIVAGGATLAGCTADGQTATTSLVPLVDPDDIPVATIAPTTTQATSSDPNSPLIPAIPELECDYADILPGGEITFVVGDRLFGASLDGSVVRCLTVLQPNQRGPAKWSPHGNRVLLNAATLFDVQGTRASGFDELNTRVQWEFPSGDAVFGPTASNRTLVRREAVDPNQRTEITFLSTTDAAVSYPAGGATIAAGQSADGVAGVFIATTGAAPRPLVTTSDPALTINDVAADAIGDLVYVLSDNGVSFRIHQVQLPSLAVTEVTSEQAPIQQLTTGPTSRAVAWKVGLCNNLTETRVRDDRTATPLTVGQGTPLEGQSLSPVGWLDATRLVVSSRPLGCDGPADVWFWNLLDGSATLLVKNVEFVATRTVNDLAAPLSIDPAVQPPAI